MHCNEIFRRICAKPLNKWHTRRIRSVRQQLKAVQSLRALTKTTSAAATAEEESWEVWGPSLSRNHLPASLDTNCSARGLRLQRDAPHHRPLLVLHPAVRRGNLAMKTYGTGRCRHYMDMSGQLHVPAALTPVHDSGIFLQCSERTRRICWLLGHQITRDPSSAYRRLDAGFFPLTLRLWRWRRNAPPKHPVTQRTIVNLKSYSNYLRPYDGVKLSPLGASTVVWSI
jgi:hypothetical protein